MNTPNIRFKGFTEDWEQRKVSDITASFSGGTPQVGNTDYYNGDIPFIRSGEIYGDKTELFITQDGFDNSSAKMVSKGDILYALYGATSGEVSRARFDGAINQAILALVPNEKNNADFLVEWFRKEKNNIIDKYLQGGQGNLSAQIIKSLEISIPIFEEQNMIGDFFSSINFLITLHQRKCDSLKQVKKYMLQKMFPKQGEEVPEIRFAGFTDDWEQRKLSALCEKITVGIANSATHAYTDDGVVMFRNQNIKENYLDDSDVIHIDDEFEQKYVNKRLRGNDLLVARTGYPGTACVVPAKYEGAQTFTTLIARLNEGTNPYYACQYINSDYGKKYFLSTQIGGGQKNSGAGILDEFPMILPPTIEEQNKIAGYLSNLDNLITLHQRKSDSLIEIKKFMLQNMFPRE